MAVSINLSYHIFFVSLGALATGLFATIAVNTAGSNGFFYGNPHQFLIQFLAVAAVWIYSCSATFLIFKFVDVVIGTRVPKKEEMLGLDISQHGERAYQL